MASLGYSNGKNNPDSEIYFIETYKVSGKKNPQKRVVKRCGRLGELLEKDPDILEKLRKEAHEWGKTDGCIDNQRVALSILQNEIDAQKHGKPCQFKKKNYAWLILDAIYKDMGIEKGVKRHCETNKIKLDLNKVMKLALFKKIIGPDERIGLFEFQFSLLGEWNLRQKDIAKGMELIGGLKNVVEKSLAQGIDKHIGRSRRRFFYAVADCAFETEDWDDGLIGGYVGETPQAGGRRLPLMEEGEALPFAKIGVLLDENGIPMSFTPHSRKFSQAEAISNAIWEIRDAYDFCRIVVVADGKKKRPSDFGFLLDEDCGWISAMKIAGDEDLRKRIIGLVDSDDGWCANSSGTFATRSITSQEDEKDGEKATRKMVVVWSEKDRERRKSQRESILEEIECAIESGLVSPDIPDANGECGNSVKADGKCENSKNIVRLKLDADAVKLDARLDGLSILATSESRMNDFDVVRHYQSLKNIEQVFKISQSILDAKTQGETSRNLLLSNLVINFLALAFLRVIKHRIKGRHDGRSIIGAMKNMTASYWNDDIWKLDIEASSFELMEKLNIPHPEYLVKDGSICVKQEKLFRSFRHVMGGEDNGDNP